jgi:hypothetical protein
LIEGLRFGCAADQQKWQRRAGRGAQDNVGDTIDEIKSAGNAFVF